MVSETTHGGERIGQENIRLVDLVRRLYYSKSPKITQQILKEKFGLRLTQKQIKNLAKKASDLTTKFDTFKEAFFSTNDFRVRQGLIDFLTAEKKRLKHPDSKSWIEEVWKRIKN
ncbi:MAG: hypothetical protein WC554_16530 [Clostridia bacterium]